MNTLNRQLPKDLASNMLLKLKTDTLCTDCDSESIIYMHTDPDGLVFMITANADSITFHSTQVMSLSYTSIMTSSAVTDELRNYHNELFVDRTIDYFSDVSEDRVEVAYSQADDGKVILIDNYMIAMDKHGDVTHLRHTHHSDIGYKHPSISEIINTMDRELVDSYVRDECCDSSARMRADDFQVNNHILQPGVNHGDYNTISWTTPTAADAVKVYRDKKLVIDTSDQSFKTASTLKLYASDDCKYLVVDPITVGLKFETRLYSYTVELSSEGESGKVDAELIHIEVESVVKTIAMVSAGAGAKESTIALNLSTSNHAIICISNHDDNLQVDTATYVSKHGVIDIEHKVKGHNLYFVELEHPAPTGISKLVLNGCNIISLNWDRLKRYSHSLEQLNLSNTSLHASLNQFNEMHNLKSLNLNNTCIEVNRGSLALDEIVSIDISNNRQSSKLSSCGDIGELINLDKCPSLAQINLKHNAMRLDAVIRNMYKYYQSRRIATTITIDARGNVPISSSSLQALSAMKHDINFLVDNPVLHWKREAIIDDKDDLGVYRLPSNIKVNLISNPDRSWVELTWDDYNNNPAIPSIFVGDDHLRTPVDVICNSFAKCNSFELVGCSMMDGDINDIVSQTASTYAFNDSLVDGDFDKFISNLSFPIKIDLSNTRVTGACDYIKSTTLQYLDLSNTDVVVDIGNALLENLQVLKLANTPATWNGDEHRLMSVETLDISHTKVHASIPHILRTMPVLRKLVADGCDLAPAAGVKMNHSALRSLSIRGCSIYVSTDALPSELVELDCSDCMNVSINNVNDLPYLEQLICNNTNSLMSARNMISVLESIKARPSHMAELTFTIDDYDFDRIFMSYPDLMLSFELLVEHINDNTSHRVVRSIH